MGTKADLYGWIDPKNTEQIEWINNYLSRQSLPYKLLDMEIRMHHGLALIPSDLKLLIIKMRAAWRQKQFRSKQNGKKTYSFVMSTTVEKKLKAMSGKGKIRETLEELINNRNEFIAPEIKNQHGTNKKLKEELLKIKADYNKLDKANKELNKEAETKDSEIATLEHRIKRLQQEYAYISHKLEQLKEKHNNQLMANKASDMTLDNKNADT